MKPWCCRESQKETAIFYFLCPLDILSISVTCSGFLFKANLSAPWCLWRISSPRPCCCSQMLGSSGGDTNFLFSEVWADHPALSCPLPAKHPPKLMRSYAQDCHLLEPAHPSSEKQLWDTQESLPVVKQRVAGDRLWWEPSHHGNHQRLHISPSPIKLLVKPSPALHCLVSWGWHDEWHLYLALSAG